MPLVGITARQASPFTVTGAAGRQTFKWGDDIVAWTKHVADGAAIDQSELVFAGYGVEAPEFNWDDFKDVDVKGKTIIVLVNDPAVPDPADPAPARSEDLRRQRDDLLRPLDLQVRRGRPEGRGGQC